MKRRLVLALTLCIATAGCARAAGPVNEGPIVAATPAPAASASPTAAPLPVALEGQVNNTETRDLTALGASVALEVQMLDFSFTPSFIKVAPGANVKMTLKNGGTLADHTFTIDSLAVDRQLKPGATDEVVVQLPQSGAFRFYCRFHAERGMQGAFFFNAGDSVSAVTMTPAPSGASSGTTSSAARRTTRSVGRTSTATSASGTSQGDPDDLVIPDLEIGDMVPGGSIGGNQTPRTTQNAARSSGATQAPQTNAVQGTPAKSGTDGAPSAPGAPGAAGVPGSEGTEGT